jgi:hypothetical protein
VGETTTSIGFLVDIDVYLIKTDSEGEELWHNTFGGSSVDSGSSVQQTTDGGYIIAGKTISFGAGKLDVYLIKTDSDGDEIWSKTFGGADHDEGNSVQQTTDGGYIIAGRTISFGTDGSAVYLIKTDSDGNELWYKTFDGFLWSYGFSVQQTTDGGYIIAGEAWPWYTGEFDVYLIKTDSDGDEIWSKTADNDGGYSVQQTTDEGYIIAGETRSFGAGSYDVYLIKTDSEGEELWHNTFGGPDGDVGFSVNQTTDGGYIIAGRTWSFGAGKLDVYLIKTDSDGDEIWSKTFGGEHYERAYSVQQTADGGYIIAGHTSSFGAGVTDVYLVKVASEGPGVIYGSIVDWWFTLGFWFSGAIFMWWLYYKWSPPVPPGDPYRSILLSVIGGVVITLLTLFIPIRSLAGATHYGLPLAWRIRLVLHPKYNPWRINIPYLIDDIVIWSLIVGVVIFFIRRRWSGARAVTQARNL